MRVYLKLPSLTSSADVASTEWMTYVALMATGEARNRLRGWIEEVISTYGKDEARLILSAASDRLASQGGGTTKEWYAAIQAAIIERHPEVDETSKSRMN